MMRYTFFARFVQVGQKILAYTPTAIIKYYKQVAFDVHYAIKES